jgi:hypothetical protein
MQRDATPPQGTHVVLLFMLCQHLPYWHQEAIPTVLNLKRLLHISVSKRAHDNTMLTHGILEFGLLVAQVVHLLHKITSHDELADPTPRYR